MPNCPSPQKGERGWGEGAIAIKVSRPAFSVGADLRVSPLAYARPRLLRSVPSNPLLRWA